MCGIFGIVGDFGVSDVDLHNSCIKYLENRGPDGINYIKKKNLYLCHSRLAINDLSKKGIQPFQDKESSIYSVTNGEIYNHMFIREKEKINLETNNDCAIIPEMFKKYGVESLNEYDGMFATAFVDLTNKEITLCRDRQGIKPLYYLEDDDFIAFSSSSQQLASLFKESNLDTLSLQLIPN